VKLISKDSLKFAVHFFHEISSAALGLRTKPFLLMAGGLSVSRSSINGQRARSASQVADGAHSWPRTRARKRPSARI
jgi:hypothetical protein